MPSKLTDVDALTITITEDGTATLSGINYNDLRSLLTAASLHRHDNPPQAKPLTGVIDDVQHENNLEEFLWHLQQGLILDVLDVRMSKAITTSWTPKATPPKYNDSDIANIKSLHTHYVAELEQTVRKAEVEAATVPAPKPDPVEEAAAAIAKALREADVALAKLRHARG